MKHTVGPWINGYGKGITGPTTPSITGPTVHESLEHEKWLENTNLPLPKENHTVVSKNGITLAIVTDAEEGEETMRANARLISTAPGMLRALLKQKEADDYFGPSNVKHQLQAEAREMRENVLDIALGN